MVRTTGTSDPMTAAAVSQHRAFAHRRFHDFVERRLKEILDSQIRELEERARKPVSASAGVRREFSGDWVDQAGADGAQEVAINSLNGASAKYRELVAARQKIQDGTFGLCENCGDRITKARLMVMPEARFCVRCQDQMEKTSGICQGRPIPVWTQPQ